MSVGEVLSSGRLASCVGPDTTSTRVREAPTSRGRSEMVARCDSSPQPEVETWMSAHGLDRVEGADACGESAEQEPETGLGQMRLEPGTEVPADQSAGFHTTGRGASRGRRHRSRRGRAVRRWTTR